MVQLNFLFTLSCFVCAQVHTLTMHENHYSLKKTNEMQTLSNHNLVFTKLPKSKTNARMMQGSNRVAEKKHGRRTAGLVKNKPVERDQHVQSEEDNFKIKDKDIRHHDEEDTEEDEAKILPGSQGVVMNIYGGENVNPPSHDSHPGDNKQDSSQLANILSHMERDEHMEMRHNQEENAIEANKQDSEAKGEENTVMDLLTQEKRKWEEEDNDIKKKIDQEEQEEEGEIESNQMKDKTIMDQSDRKAEEVRKKMHNLEMDMKEKEELIKDDKREMKELENEETLKLKEIKQDEDEKLDELKEIGEVESDSENLQRQIASNKENTMSASAIPSGVNSNENCPVTNTPDQQKSFTINSGLNSPENNPTQETHPPSLPSTGIKPCEALSFISKTEIQSAHQSKKVHKKKRPHTLPSGSFIRHHDTTTKP